MGEDCGGKRAGGPRTVPGLEASVSGWQSPPALQLRSLGFWADASSIAQAWVQLYWEPS